jgi:hypothetical protein
VSCGTGCARILRAEVREAPPIVTRPDTPYEFGLANVIRYRGQQAKFLDAFETIPGPR